MGKKGEYKYSYEELAEIASQYNDNSEFRKMEKSAYNQMSKRGLIKELCAHMKRNVVPHTNEELAAIASGYNDLTLFKRERKNIYAAIVRRGKIDELCGHMKRHMRLDYTDEELAELAKDYDDLTLFRKAHRQPYFAIVRRGKVNELCGHMKRNKPETYTEEELRCIARKYKTRDQFHKKDGGAYLATHRRGILDDVCVHMDELRRPKGFYSKGYCHVIALGYKTRGDFQQGNRSAYNRAFNEGWLDDICGHMEAENNWNKRKVYVYTFADGYAYVGLTDDVKRRKNEHLHKYTHKKLSPVLRHSRETGESYEYKELTDWLDAATAAKVEDEYISKYQADGWNMLNRQRGGGLGGNVRKQHKEKAIRTIVGRYEYVEDFKDGEPELYEELCHRRQFSTYCSGLKRRKKPSGYWTMERSIAVVQECETISILKQRYYQAYMMVKKAGLHIEYYPESPKPKRKWTLEKCANAARYCETKAEFRKKYRGAYKRLLKEGLLDELFEDKQEKDKRKKMEARRQ